MDIKIGQHHFDVVTDLITKFYQIILLKQHSHDWEYYTQGKETLKTKEKGN